MNNSTMTLEEKHLQAITNNVREISAWEAEGIEGQDLASKECAKITLQHCIEVLKELRDSLNDNEGYTISLYAQHKIDKIEQQLSDLNLNK